MKLLHWNLLLLVLLGTQAPLLSYAQDTPAATVEKNPEQLKNPLSSSAAESRFSVQVNFAETAGLEANLRLQTLNANYAYIRVFLVLDGKLLVIPLLQEGTPQQFKVAFPTPHDTATYQFQFFYTDGSTSMSNIFAVNPKCQLQNLDRALIAATDFEKQASLIRESIDLQNEASLLRYSAQTLVEVVGAEQ